MLAEDAAAALLAFAAHSSVLADATTATVLADAALSPVLANAAAVALLALAAPPPVLTEEAAAALLAMATLPSVLADTAATAVLALAALPPVRTRHDRRRRARTPRPAPRRATRSGKSCCHTRVLRPPAYPRWDYWGERPLLLGYS